jgi:hypothetical protein
VEKKINDSKFKTSYRVMDVIYSISAVYWFPVQIAQKFFLEVAFENGRLYFWIYYLGSLEKAKDFKCKIKAYGDSDVEYK